MATRREREDGDHLPGGCFVLLPEASSSNENAEAVVTSMASPFSSWIAAEGDANASCSVVVTSAWSSSSLEAGLQQLANDQHNDGIAFFEGDGNRSILSGKVAALAEVMVFFRIMGGISRNGGRGRREVCERGVKLKTCRCS